MHEKLSIGWTPELIAGRLKHQDQLPTVCHESIYQYSCAQHLIGALPRHHRKRRSHRPYRKSGERIKNRTGLDQRPKAATTRREYDHWEADMIVAGDRNHGLKGLVERKSRLTHISVLPYKKAAATIQVMHRRPRTYPASLTQSITYDNGRENTCLEALNEALGTMSFFCAPYHSGEKGSVEQVNGCIRRFLPQGTNFHELARRELNRIEKLLNHRPRKCLNDRTPYEIFREARGALDG